jgi:orotidine-5'-phosphate decarboxylase
MMRVAERRVIPALDVLEIDSALRIVRSVGDMPIVYGFKLGFPLALSYGLPTLVEQIRRISNKPIIYDHQKGGTDIPDTGQLFAEVLQRSGISEAILFPQAGPVTLRAWVDALRERDVKVIIGGVMTHAGYLVSEGGYLVDEAILGIYGHAAELGVRSFVVPLTRLELVRSVADSLQGVEQCEFYSPGFGTQGGGIEGLELLSRLYVIIGRSLLKAENPERYLSSLEREWGAGL